MILVQNVQNKKLLSEFGYESYDRVILEELEPMATCKQCE